MDNNLYVAIVLAAAAAAIAYLLGTRRGRAAAARKERERDRARPPAPGDGTKDEGLAARESEPEAPAPEPKDPAPESNPEEPAPGSNKPTAPPPPEVTKGDSGLVRLDYEEDEENDPTKVGKVPMRSMPPESASGFASSIPPDSSRELAAFSLTPPADHPIHQPPVKKIIFDDDALADEPTREGLLFLVSATAQTDRGRRRKRNEDSLCVLDTRNLFIVADGMGGYRGGDLASQLAVKVIADAFRNGTFEGPPHDGLPKAATDLARAIQMANATIQGVAKKNPQLEGMGTTVCAAVFSPTKGRLFIGHVGDSRCYRLRNGVFRQITNDHTMAELGIKGPEAAQLSRAVGIWDTVLIDVLMGAPQPGDVYLLCSDGLTKMLEDDVIANVLRNEEDPKLAVERLVLFANSRGGKDNITVVLIRVVPPNWRPKPSEPFAPAKGTSDPPPSSVPLSKGPPAGASGRIPAAPRRDSVPSSGHERVGTPVPDGEKKD
jgi:protein phosphatase